MMDVGLIGFGLAGRSFHAPVIRAVPGLRLAAILQRHGSDAAEKYPDVRVVRGIEELLAIPEIRLIVIASPNQTHFDYARRALLAGRHVLVDKPFTTTSEEARTLVKLARELGRVLTVYQNRRYDGDFQALRKLVAAATFGRIVRFETNYDRFRPNLRENAWREQPAPGAGILFDIGPHLIDHALVLFGLPSAITADVRSEREHALTDDSFDIMFHYPRGLRAVLRSTMLAAVPRPRFILHGTRGSFFKQSFDPQEANLRKGYIPTDTAWGAEPQENWGVLAIADGETLFPQRVPSDPCDYRDFYANLRDTILGHASLVVTPEWSLDIMRLLELARESSKEGRTIPFPAA